jgi:hypothetical protein
MQNVAIKKLCNICFALRCFNVIALHVYKAGYCELIIVKNIVGKSIAAFLLSFNIRLLQLKPAAITIYIFSLKKFKSFK